MNMPNYTGKPAMPNTHAGPTRSTLRHLLALCAASLLLASCATTTSHHNPLAVWTPSPNFNARRASMIVLHYTREANAKDALHTLRTRNPGGPVSAHYLVGRNGTIYQLVANDKRAWQAGTSWWGFTDDVNSRSIGIEIDNSGAEPFPKAQMQALLRLLGNLTRTLHIPRTAIVGHADVAPTRRADPGVLFPWAKLARHGFGLWYDSGSLPKPPPGFNPMLALRLIGYDITDPVAAVIAWHRHFRANSATTFDARDLDILWNLEGKIMCQGLSHKHPHALPPAPPFDSAHDYHRDLKHLGVQAVKQMGDKWIPGSGDPAVVHRRGPKPATEVSGLGACH